MLGGRSPRRAAGGIGAAIPDDRLIRAHRHAAMRRKADHGEQDLVLEDPAETRREASAATSDTATVRLRDTGSSGSAGERVDVLRDRLGLVFLQEVVRWREHHVRLPLRARHALLEARSAPFEIGSRSPNTVSSGFVQRSSCCHVSSISGTPGLSGCSGISRGKDSAAAWKVPSGNGAS